MMIDENEFFRDATLRLCGHLEFEDALLASVKFLRQEMPVDEMFLQIFDAGLNAMRIMAIATPEKGTVVDRLTPLSNAALKEMWRFAEELKQHKPRHVWLFRDNPYDQILTREIAEYQGFTITSLMVMPLGLTQDREMVGRGSLVLITEGPDRFSPRHADRLSLLKEPFAIAMSNALRHREVLRLRDRLADDNQALRRELLRLSGDQIIGADFGLRKVMRQVRQVASTESPVLLTGETGVGKDVIANAIHLSSARRDGPFIPVNCGAIADSLIDSELFGHERGAFTGALTRKHGRFERADRGTILLDEIGEMPLEAQVRLLRVLQHREIERVGGIEPIGVDVRIIAATHQDLSQMVQDGTFRQDLYFRLNVFPIFVPPLRERITDVPALVQFFIEKKAKELKIGATPHLAGGAIENLMAYDWPGNVRELENVIERAMILYRGEALRFDDLGRLQSAHAIAPTASPPDDQPAGLDAAIARHIRQVLDRTGGKIHGPGGAGELLGINPNTLRNRMRKLGIPFKKNAGANGR